MDNYFFTTFRLKKLPLSVNATIVWMGLQPRISLTFDTWYEKFADWFKRDAESSQNVNYKEK